ncbi:MAG: hypothetical protein ACLFQM_11340 [Fidelibacterota bacterium]
MIKKVFALNNSGTEVQTVLASYDSKEQIINVENAEINSFAATIDTAAAPSHDMPDMGETPDDTLSAQDLLGNAEQEINNYTQDQFTPSGGSEYEHNERVLSRIFRIVDQKSFDMAINMPSKFMKSVFVNKNFPDLKGRKKEQMVKKEVNNKLDRPVNETNFDYINTVDDKILAFTYEGLPPFFNIYEKVKDQLKIRPKIKSILPGELALTNLIKYNYEPAEDEYIAIVQITTELSRIIITRGGRILHISQPINEHANSPGLLNKISGRLLFEKDVSSIDHFSKIIIAGEREERDVADYLKKQFSDNETIAYFQPEESKFVIDPEFVSDDMSKMASAFGLLVTELLFNVRHENYVDLVPDYIKNRQSAFKLSWYNITLLILLALTPVFLVSLYTQKKREYDEWLDRTQVLNQQLQEIQYVEAENERLNSEFLNITGELGNVKTVSKGSNQLSETLKILNQKINDTGGIWLDRLRFEKTKIELDGFSKYRNRIPELVSSFEQAKVSTIQPVEIREAVVYKFNIVIERLVKDESIFDPQTNENNEG